MKYRPKDFYAYYRDCYKLDYKEFEVNNILSHKHSFKWFVSKTEELLSGKLPIIPYFNTKTEELEKEIELFKLEKKLFYGCFFLIGKKESSFSKDKRVCAPLFLFPAEIETINEEKYLKIERDNLIINRAVLTKLEPKESNLTKDNFIQEVSDLLNADYSDFISLKSLFDKYFSNIDTNELLLYPTIWPVSKIRKDLSEKEYSENHFKIIPAAGTVFIKKSESSLRVLNDLSELAKSDAFNSSIQNLINEECTETEFGTSLYKSRLNTDQYKALQNAYRFTNSVIVGPPGTGKTYTITSIVSDAVLNNKSVLVVSKTKQAVEVLRSMLQDDFKLKENLIHTTGRNYKLSLKVKIRKYLSGISARKDFAFKEVVIHKLFNELSQLEEQFEHFVEHELELSDLEFAKGLNLLNKWKRFYLNIRSFNGDKLWQLFNNLDNVLLRLEREISYFTKGKIQSNINNNFRLFRKDISRFLDALEASSFSEYKRLLTEVKQENILKAFPIWLANLSDLNSVLPLEKDLFDLVIIDEATQCDIASALPALYRAKKAIVVGDPNQLRHYSFVSSAQQFSLQEKHGLPEDKILDYRNRSILDFFISKVADQQQVSFLREHFRSTPSLIEFSNKQFYDGQLEVLKSTPRHIASNQLEIVNTEGKRNDRGVNEVEANAVIDKLDSLIKKHNYTPQKPSIGIISPFSKQVAHINKLLKDKYGLEELKMHKILCGSPYNFQGSERDIILLSFAVCDLSHPSAFIHVNKPEVLNVAITRAKSYQVIFKSVADESMNKESLLYQYFKFAEEFSHINGQSPEKDNFQNEVYHELVKLKYDSVHCGYPLAGNMLDVLVTNQNKNYFIDLIGYPGMFKEAFTLERYKTLARTGVKSFPLHYSFWRKDKAAAIKIIKKVIKRRVQS
ncbi:DEAD/DEAH box helicase [Carboxylicivirga sp. M1479]|uniref:AAA domain-containing protein n=1 Tax=Carboxylicivirga sp. M1479 TaxID=2594476 RepID=UPI001177C26B|nr:DEAD/DEAH box helicase [Carboxylicivirga sp. M1479]TRX66383.1 AAA family ATPase [Carboxylicivirga sp. M1479]